MKPLPRLLYLALAPLALAACGSAGTSETRLASPEPSAGSGGTQSAVVLDGDELAAGESLLRSLVGRMANIEVLASNRGCPEVHLRGRQSILASPGPSIYVDGARAVNTCVLDEIAPSEVRRVEVYPMGVHIGYASDRNGLILVFMRDGTDG
ncbi:MAG TPA: hypothetical protein VFJ82_25935 [Longimicrobium sp.]|nr:hypothetical protein [Longimicrobium sp.]